MVFFSVPYEGGWSAQVNGEPVAIERVNVGFMAVTVPEGEGVTIEFTYRTPGLTLGFGITLVSLALLVAYLMLMHRPAPKGTPPSGAQPVAGREILPVCQIPPHLVPAPRGVDAPCHPGSRGAF